MSILQTASTGGRSLFNVYNYKPPTSSQDMSLSKYMLKMISNIIN